VTFAAGGLAYAEGLAAELERELGVTIRLEEYDDHFDRLHLDPLPMWTLGWVADYPGPNDFLGVLLGTGSSNNYGSWSSAAFDTAIGDALATRDPDEALAAYERALAAVRDEVPAILIANGDGWALPRRPLGAGQNGAGHPPDRGWHGNEPACRPRGGDRGPPGRHRPVRLCADGGRRPDRADVAATDGNRRVPRSDHV
jgi:ABC-type transport system substrate-binding protein